MVDNRKRLKEWTENSVEVYKYITPEGVEIVKEAVEGIDDNITLDNIRYSDGNPEIELIFSMEADEAIHRDQLFGRTLIISKINDFKEKLHSELNDKLNIVTINLISYKVYKTPSKAEFCLLVLMSFTPVQVNKAN